MPKTLLEKSRAISKLLQKIAGNPVDFYEMAGNLCENLDSSVFIVGRRGHISGYAFQPATGCRNIEKVIRHAERFPESFNRELSEIMETRYNIVLQDSRKCIFNINDVDCNCTNKVWLITPIFGGARRIGTLILKRAENEFGETDVVMAEYGALVVANEVMRMRSERVEDEVRQKASVQIAMATLSNSEKEAIEYIINELNDTEGILVASRIADQMGITRSVIVNALKKFESAGVIESRSLGMKGTYIKVLNNYLLEELKKA